MRFFYSILFCFSTFLTFAQVPDWTKETCEPISYNMYEELAANKAVLIEFSAMWCSACNQEAGNLQNLWQDYKNEEYYFSQFCFLFEDLNNSTTDCNEGESWISTHGLTFPVFVNCTDVLNAYYDEYIQTGGYAIPWILLFLPDAENQGQSTVAYDGNSIEEARAILESQWIPQAKLNTNKEIEAIQFFPNPTNGMLTIQNLDAYTEVSMIELIDIMGRKQTVQINQESNLDVSDLVPGIYYLSITHQSGTTKTCFVKN
jgi:peroxiredoxin